jgi:hypothetical protein
VGGPGVPAGWIAQRHGKVQQVDMTNHHATSSGWLITKSYTY